MRIKRTLLSVALVVSLLVLLYGAARLHPVHSTLPFSVSSPQDGQVVHPGDTVQVVVQPTSGVTLSYIQLLSPIKSVILTAVEPISIPITAEQFGSVTLAIIAATATGSGGEIDRTIDIEPSSPPVSLRLSTFSVRVVAPNTSKLFTALSTDSVRLFAHYADSTELEITNSAQTTFSTDNARVATVDNTGQVFAVAPGITNLRARYGSMVTSAVIQVNIFELRGDLDGDSDVDQDDLNVLLKALNTASTGSGDPRDLNGDGRINDLDSRILVSLCSRSACTTH